MNARFLVAVILATAEVADGSPKESGSTENVTVCMGTPVAAAPPAQAITSEIFARIGVRIDWRGQDNCPVSGISIRVRLDTPPELLPGALAFALPFEGTHIFVFFDRIHGFGSPMETGLLSQVLAHEIGHILEGFPRHSEEGLMKAQWNKEERDRKKHHQPLGFAAADVDLIHRGLAERARRAYGRAHGQ